MIDELDVVDDQTKSLDKKIADLIVQMEYGSELEALEEQRKSLEQAKENRPSKRPATSSSLIASAEHPVRILDLKKPEIIKYDVVALYQVRILSISKVNAVSGKG